MLIDAFPYSDQSTPPEILALRLAELAALVDVHVIVEGTETFTGKPSVPAWPKLIARPGFSEHADRVVHVVFDYPEDLSPWARDEWCRDQVARAVHEYLSPAASDHVLFGDVDEIPRRGALTKALPGQKLEGRYHEWWLDLAAIGSPSYLWEFRQPVVVTTRTLWHYGGHHIRANSGHMPAVDFEPGWHFTLQGGPEACVRKLSSYAHTELGHLRRDHIWELIERERDILGRCGLVHVPMEELPSTLITIPDPWAHMLSPAVRPPWPCTPLLERT